jgi:endoglucanase
LKYKLFVTFIILFLISCSSQSTSTITLRTGSNESEASDRSTPTSTIKIISTIPGDVFAFEQNRRLGKGVNLGNTLEAPNEGDWGLTIKEEYFDLIQEAGFDSVRIPIRFSEHAQEESPYTIDPAFFERVDAVINQALERNLAVIVDMHHYVEIHEEPRLHKERFLSLWDQIAQRYQDLPDSVFFELLNEPTGTLGVVSWNEFAAEALKLIRKTNPQRSIIVGPGSWNSIDALPGLLLPEDDRNIIVTFHYYQPFQFTHQGAEWTEGSDAWLGTTWQGTQEEQNNIIQSFDQAVKWADSNRRPLFLGEFGAYYKADLDSRVRWTEFMAQTAESFNMSWSYWEFGSGFGLYDPTRQEWNNPLLHALLPES